MDSFEIEYLITFVASYLLAMLFLLAYKAALNDLFVKTKSQIFKEIRAVHPTSLLAAFVSLIPVAIARNQLDAQNTTIIVVAGVGLYFLLTMLWRRINGLKLMDFSIDNGSNFNDEVSADPTWAQKIWLFLVSWAGAVVMGVISGFTLSYNSWKDQTSWLTDQPSENEARIYVYIFSGLIVVSLILFSVLRSKKFRRLPTAARLRRAINRTWFTPSIFGLMFALLQDFTRNATLTNRYWTIAVFTWIGVAMLWYLVFEAPNLKRHLTEDRVFFDRRQKELKRQRKNKRKKRR